MPTTNRKIELRIKRLKLLKNDLNYYIILSEKGFQSLVLSNPLSNSPCAPFNPCLFGGHCLPDGEDYTCLCPADRGGSHCERKPPGIKKINK